MGLESIAYANFATRAQTQVIRAASLCFMGRRKRRKEAKAAAEAADMVVKPKKKRRLRKLVVLGSVFGGLAAWRQRQLAENEQKFGPR